MRSSTAILALTFLTCSITAPAMTLGDALTLASQHDAGLASSQAALAAESEVGEQERSRLRPSITIESRGNFSHSDSQFAFGSAQDKYPSWSAYLQVRQALLRLDWSARKDRAAANDNMAQANARDAGRDFVVRVAGRYLNTLLARDAVEQARSEVRAVDESLSDTQKRFDVGLVPRTDLKEARARADLARAQMLAAEAELEDWRDALAEVTGYDRSPLPLLRHDVAIPEQQPDNIEGWMALAVKNGTATQTARLRLELAKANLQSRRAEVLPQLDLLAQAGRNESTEYILGQRQDDATVSLELSIPIYAGGLGQSRIREATARLEEAEVELRRIQLEAERDIRARYRSIQTARAEETAYTQALASATLAQAAAQAGYDAGSRTITDVLDAKSRVVQARRNRNASRYLILTRMLLLNAAAGTLDAALVKQFDWLFASN